MLVMKYDLKIVMKKAWELMKMNKGYLFSECLKEAWRAAKIKSNEIKTWFISKNFTSDEQFIADCSEKSIEKETQKACLVKFNSKYGVIRKWVPKSCFCTGFDLLDEIIEDEKRELAIVKYERLLVWASKQGLKVGNRPRKKNLIAKIIKNGLNVPKWAF